VSHYANARPTRESWRKDVLGPFRRLILRNAPIPGTLPVFGVHSFEELEATLAEYRDVLERLSKLRPSHVDEARDLTELITQRSRLRVKRHAIDRTTRHLVTRWETETKSFSEMLYAYLALSFYQVPIDALRRCVACEQFYFCTSGQKTKYCTGRCQIRIAMKNYRARHRHPRGTSKLKRSVPALNSPDRRSTLER
jgi:hypothetical protein